MKKKTTQFNEPEKDNPLSPDLRKSNKNLHSQAKHEPSNAEVLGLLTPDNSEVKTFTELYMAVQPSLQAFLSTIVRNPAAVEDCLQETCIVLWKKRDPAWKIEDFRRLAFTCARFKGLSWLKKNKPNLNTALSPEITKKLSMKMAEHELRNKNNLSTRLDAMSRCLDKLSETQRKIIQARYESVQTDALAKISSSLGRSMDAIYKQLERIRTVLRKCIQQQLSS